MNTRQFIVLFFNLALLSFASAIFDLGTAGLGTVMLDGALTIPLATATAGTLATPLAVLGVLKLGAAAALALGYITLGGNNDGYSDSGYGYGGDFHRRRYRRDAEEVEAHQDGLFALISSMDTYGCGKQLVCELEAKNEAELADDEKLMIQLFSKHPRKTVNPYSHKSEYELAANLGVASKNQMICRQRYANCPYTSDEMMAALRNAHI